MFSAMIQNLLSSGGQASAMQRAAQMNSYVQKYNAQWSPVEKIINATNPAKIESFDNVLKASGKGFFIDKDGYALGIRDELADVIKVDAFKKQMKDIIEYRTMEYYRRRYVEK